MFSIFHFQSDETHPHMDLCASNNALNVRTCWDSASALCRLVTYIAVDGDNLPPGDPASRHASFCSDQTEPLIGKTYFWFRQSLQLSRKPCNSGKQKSSTYVALFHNVLMQDEPMKYLVGILSMIPF